MGQRIDRATVASSCKCGGNRVGLLRSAGLVECKGHDSAETRELAAKFEAVRGGAQRYRRLRRSE